MAFRRVIASARDLLTAVTPGWPHTVRFEQAVYGSFPFRDRGYAMLATSPGCRPQWLAEFRAACQRIGERPARVNEAAGMFTLRFDDGVRLVVGMSPQGRDDRGRPGALAFHGLFLSDHEYRKAGSSPFNLLGALRSEWSADTAKLPSGLLRISAGPAPGVASPEKPLSARIALALTNGRRVIVESPRPIDTLAQSVWEALSVRIRNRASVATWVFGNDNRFDLLAVPRLAGVAVDGSYDVEIESAAENGCA